MNNTSDNKREIINITFDGIIIPAIPLLWYREDQLYIPPENIELINSNIINQIYPNNNLKIDNNNCFKIVQKNILQNPNLYISFHTLSFYLDTKRIVIDNNFNRSYRWDCITYSSDDNVLFLNGPNNLKNNN